MGSQGQTAQKIQLEGESAAPFFKLLEEARAQLNEKIRGQDEVVERSLATFLAGGHLLLEGPPGVGKTSLARALAGVFEAQFRRVQMTSDLLPSEILGILRPSPDGKEFEFRKGPIFTHFLLTDELNRTTPKTQAALLEAMAEETVSIDGKSYTLPDPFFVIATQNPLESHGVFPLAESQLDRFMLQVRMDLPGEKQELRIYQNGHDRSKGKDSPDVPIVPRSVFNLDQSKMMRAQAAKVFVEETVLHYAVSLIRKTRNHPEVASGISVRGGKQFIAAIRALAYVRGKEFATPKEVRDLAIPTLAHRLKMEDGVWENEPKERVIRQILDEVPPPK